MKLITLNRYTNEEKETITFLLNVEQIVGMEDMPDGGTFVITARDNYGVSETTEEILNQINS